MRPRLALCLALLTFAAPRAGAYGAAPAPAAASVVRLRTDGHLCTAFVVASRPASAAVVTRGGEPTGLSEPAGYDNLVVTAGHCLGSDMRITWHPVQLANGRWSPAADAVFTPIAYARDFDILVGTAPSSWPIPALRMDTSPLASGARVEVLGYGMGALGAKVAAYSRYDPARGMLLVDGTIAPGYSGSPVLLAGTDRVVGIAVQQQLREPGMALACAVGSRRGCVTVPPYSAVPIRRVGELANLSNWPTPQ